jgi:hypothetical protein
MAIVYELSPDLPSNTSSVTVINKFALLEVASCHCLKQKWHDQLRSELCNLPVLLLRGVDMVFEVELSIRHVLGPSFAFMLLSMN